MLRQIYSLMMWSRVGRRVKIKEPNDFLDFLHPYHVQQPPSRSGQAAHSYIRYHHIAIHSFSSPNHARGSAAKLARGLNKKLWGIGQAARAFTSRAKLRDHQEDNSRFTYPRIGREKNECTIPEFLEKYKDLEVGKTEDLPEVCVYGRVLSVRSAGKNLGFVDIQQHGQTLQYVLNHKILGKQGANIVPDSLRTYLDSIKRGDIQSIRGRPVRTNSGELSILATDIPVLMAPSLNGLPREVTNEETLARNKHLDLLLHPASRKTLELRSHLINTVRGFLIERGHIEVQTPVLADGFGGAVARPFNTYGTEFSERRLALRISPELWLKRLIIGGMERVFEIGPCFRNEGIDTTHNPEFWTCEFYRTYTGLEELMTMTEAMFHKITEKDQSSSDIGLTSFRVLDFIPAIQEAAATSLPDLSTPDADSRLIEIMREREIPITSEPSLPRLLDKLCAHYLEPQCQTPTWIRHQPECLSPLAKSFVDQDSGQRVAARAELFIDGLEVVNTYEEENSFIAQREKFSRQRKYNEEESTVDESYLAALEDGLPPTGGWGCGLDRLVMLIAQQRRIADVLAFGTLQNVVAVAGNVSVSRNVT